MLASLETTRSRLDSLTLTTCETVRILGDYYDLRKRGFEGAASFYSNGAFASARLLLGTQLSRLVPPIGDITKQYTIADSPVVERASQIAWRSQGSVDQVTWKKFDFNDPMNPVLPYEGFPLHNTKWWQEELDPALKPEHMRRFLGYVLSQLERGEEAAAWGAYLMRENAASQAEYQAAHLQLTDERRHRIMIRQYLEEHVQRVYPLSPHLGVAMGGFLKTPYLDEISLVLQLGIESLALGLLKTVRDATADKLLRQLIHFILADEGRHVGQGEDRLESFYKRMPQSELDRKRQIFTSLIEIFKTRAEFSGLWSAHYRKFPYAEWVEGCMSSPLTGRFFQNLDAEIIPRALRCGLFDEEGLVAYGLKKN